MAWTNIQIANLALGKFGSRPIQTFDDTTPSGEAVALFYEHVVDGIFASYPWAFARQTVPLAQLSETVLSDGNLPSGWTNAFQLPGNLVGPPERILANARQPDGPLERFEIQNTTVFTNQLALWCVGVFRVDEGAWPGYFRTAVVDVLAATIYPRITGNGPLAAKLTADAYGPPEDNRRGGSLGAARRRDASQNPSRMLAHNPLIDVRTSTTDIRTTGALYP